MRIALQRPRRGVAQLVGMIAAVAALLGPVAAEAGAATRYVSTDGGDAANDCLVQAAPCATIQHAVNQAADGDIVDVGAGDYAESVTIAKAVDLRGPNAGVDPNAETRLPEATISTSGEATTIMPQVPGIAIDGFTVSASDIGYPIYTLGTDITGLTVENNVLGSGVRALTVATSGADLRIARNRIDGKGYGVHFGTGAYADVAIEQNVISGPVDYYAIFINGEGAIDGFQFEGNTITGKSNIAADITNGSVSENAFDVEAPGSMNLQINLHDSSLTQNTFDGNGTTGCLQLFGSQFGLVPSKNVLVAENRFDDCNAYGIQLSPEIEEITIAGNTIVNAHDGINTRDLTSWDVSGKDIRISSNRIVGSIHAGVANSVAGILDARDNWWGCNAGPGAAGCSPIAGSVETSPHIVLVGEAANSVLGLGAGTLVSARLDRNSAGEAVSGIPDGAIVSFGSDLGSFSTSTAPLAAGSASSTFAAGQQAGAAGVSVEVDGEEIAVPLTIVGPVSPPPPPAPPAQEPKIEVGNDGNRVTVPRGGTFVVAEIDCPASSCTVRAKAPKVKIGGKLYKVRAKLRNQIGSGESTQVRIVLTKAARRALAAAGKGKASIALVVTTSDGFAKTVSVRLKLKRSGR